MTEDQIPLRIIPLGGVGEIGKNMYVFEHGDDIIVVDCGLMFPDEAMYGIDLIIPDVTYLRENREKVRAFLITHGHEDHIGGLPFILPYFPGVPVYASTLARGLLGIKIKEHKLHSNPLMPLDPGDNVQIGPFRVEPFRISHSIPDAMGMALHTPVGTVVTTGDFKFDHTAVDGRRSDFAVLSRLGEDGVICLLSDSTGAEKPGYTLSERTVVAVGHAGQAGHRLTLGAGRGDHDAVDRPYLVLCDDLTRRVCQVPEVRGDPEVLLHRSADDRDLAIEDGRRIDNLLNSGDVAGEGGNDDPAVERLHDLAESLAHRSFGERVAGLLGACRIR